jgi:hypothetical protein
MGTRPHSGSQCGPAAPSRDVHGKHRTGGCPFCVLLILADQGTDHPPRLDRVGDHPSTTVQAEPAQRRPVSPWRSTSRHARLAASMLAIRRRREPRLGLTSTAMQAIAPTTRSGQARYAAVRPQRRWPAATRAASTRPRMSLTSTLAAIEGRRRSCSEPQPVQEQRPERGGLPSAVLETAGTRLPDWPVVPSNRARSARHRRPG